MHTYSVICSIFIIQNPNYVGLSKIELLLIKPYAYFKLFP